jgi:hypothetical protein
VLPKLKGLIRQTVAEKGSAKVAELWQNMTVVSGSSAMREEFWGYWKWLEN